VASHKSTCLEFARRCVELHDKSSSTEERVQLLEMAQAWRSLAEKVGDIERLVEEAKRLGVMPPRSKMS
jgi:hypothetical protein